jgi:hypothetical protein
MNSVFIIIATFDLTVGDVTFPNIASVMNGYSEEDLVKICYPTRYTKQDDCPFIWKRFDEANYLTGLIEDSPSGAIFSYARTGFVKQPVDFYSRPFWLAAVAAKDSGDWLSNVSLSE